MDTRLAALLIAAAACGSTPVDPPAAPDAPPPNPPASLQVAPMSWAVVVDRSVSWERRLDRRLGVRAGLANFVAEAPGTMTFAASAFPKFEGASVACGVETYATPDLAWGATAAELDTHFLVPPGQGGSTLGPALAGAGAIASDRAAAAPEDELSILLLTDATPFDDEACDDSEWDRVRGIAEEIFAGGAGPHVHIVSVIGIGVSDDHFGVLHEIAKAGGGFVSFVNGSTDDIARATRTALSTMAERATCTRVLDGPRPELLEVAYDDGTRTVAHRVADATACEPNAFYVDDPEAPTKATLCSGPAGIGGFCEVTYLRARLAGPPSITPLLSAL